MVKMSSIDVILVNPLQKKPVVTSVKPGVVIDNRVRTPLGIAYTASYLRDNGFSVEIIDANALDYSNAKVSKLILKNKPKFVVITTSPLDRWECPYLDIESPTELSKLVKSKNTSIEVIFQGPHGTSNPEWVFEKCDSVDYIVRGEPEISTFELVKILSSSKSYEGLESVKGISFLKESKLMSNRSRELNKDLDNQPFPAYDLLPMEIYSKNSDKGVTSGVLVLSSRGCPFQCIFCLRNMYGMDYRYRSPQNVIDELKLLQNDYDVKAVYFQDLEFCIKKDRVYEFCKLYHENNLSIKWSCSARFNDIDEKLVKTMQQSGCKHMNLGLESGSQKVLKKVKKGIELDNASRLIKYLTRINLSFTTFFMCCLPGETKQTLKESRKFLVKQGLKIYGGNLAIPYPGTELFEMAKHKYPGIDWDNCGEYAGKVGTKLLDNRSESSLFMEIRFMYFVEKYTWFFVFNPGFWREVVYILKRFPLKMIIKSIK